MRKTAIISTMVTLLMLASCNEAPDCSIEVERETIEISHEGGTETVRVTCAQPTKTTITYNEGDGWIFLLPTYLKSGGGVLEFRISRYNQIDQDRTATATITCCDVTKEILIRQAHKPAPVVTDLDLDIYNIYSDVEGGTYQVSVSSGLAWTAVSDASWCTVENGSGSGVGTFTVKVARSEDYQYRTATVKVTAGNLEREVFVQHVGTKIGDIVWANANVNDPDTFGDNCEVRGLLYQYNCNVGYPSYSKDDSGDTETVVPGFPTGPYDTMSNEWKEENDPCPDGWRVPTIDEIKALIGDATSPKFHFDYWKAQGMSVAGAYAGLDKTILQEECCKGNLNGAIFIPQAGRVNRDTGKQDDWWDACLWSCTNVGQTWDMFGVWMNGNGDFGIEWYGSRTGCSVRCVLK